MRWHLILAFILFFLFGNYEWGELGSAISYYGNELYGTNPQIGIILFLLIIFILLFTDNFIKIYRFTRKKVKARKYNK